MKEVIRIIQQGGVIAYPTEAVYGLGCDPFNEVAVRRILKLKGRSESKGLILIAASWEQIKPLVLPINPKHLLTVKETWPEPITWLFPARVSVPHWIKGASKKIALRITSHPIAHDLCEQLGYPLVSTSANRAGQGPLRTAEEVQETFGEQLDFIVPGEVGSLEKPTEIRDVLTSKVIRVG